MINKFNLTYPATPYIFPFFLLLVFIYLVPAFNVPKGVVYPLQTVILGAVLFYFRDAYKDEIIMSFDVVAILAGIAVFIIWVLPEGLYPQIGSSYFDPYEYGTGGQVYILIGFRMIGATLVIPLMEELFWRSFALRFLINDKFKTVPLGEFSWFSFMIVSIAFGLEHHRWLPGIFAGLIYAGVLYRTKNLFSPILAHAVTNFMLGVYVILTGKWFFW